MSCRWIRALKIEEGCIQRKACSTGGPAGNCRHVSYRQAAGIPGCRRSAGVQQHQDNLHSCKLSTRFEENQTTTEPTFTAVKLGKEEQLGMIIQPGNYSRMNSCCLQSGGILCFSLLLALWDGSPEGPWNLQEI
ncbi:hypothetical protein CRENBAI_003902 [Crenichthys baileyi]|uniref:Uncharacterized protein n=1 Tax=Crenichthys baileyi TaxID=28760 RepID=A0AAV9QX88_9TELE